MKISTKSTAESNATINAVRMDTSSGVDSKIVSLLTKSQYTRNYSPIRELWLNARENEQASVKAGLNPKKTEIYLPEVPVNSFSTTRRINQMDSSDDGRIAGIDNSHSEYGEQEWFESDNGQSVIVRNYGLSMTEDEAISRIARLGSTSKSDSNEYGGGMGIGSLSPLAISDRVLFENFHDGFVTYISVFRDDSGVISYEDPYSVETDEEDGMRVSFEVNCNVHTIFDDFIQMMVLAGSSERINVFASSDTVLDFKRYTKNFSWLSDELHHGWNFFVENESSILAYGGGVLIDGCFYRSSVQDTPFYKLDSSRRVRAIYNAHVGEFDVATSREEVLLKDSIEGCDFDSPDAFGIVPLFNDKDASTEDSDSEITFSSMVSSIINEMVDRFEAVKSKGIRENAKKIVRDAVVSKTQLFRSGAVQNEDIPSLIMAFTLEGKSFYASVDREYSGEWKFAASETEPIIILDGKSSAVSDIKRLRKRAETSSLLSVAKSLPDSAAKKKLLSIAKKNEGSNFPQRSFVGADWKRALDVIGDIAENSSVDVRAADAVTYAEMDVVIRESRKEAKALGYISSQKSLAGPRREKKYKILERCEDGARWIEKSVSEIIDVVGDDDVLVVPERVADCFKNIVDTFSEYILDEEVGYATVVTTSSARQKYENMVSSFEGKIDNLYVAETIDELIFDVGDYATWCEELVERDKNRSIESDDIFWIKYGSWRNAVQILRAVGAEARFDAISNDVNTFIQSAESKSEIRSWLNRVDESVESSFMSKEKKDTISSLIEEIVCVVNSDD